MGYQKGRNLRIKIGDIGILHADNCTFTTTRNFDSIIDKDTAGDGVYEAFEPGSISFTLEHSGLLAVEGDLHSMITDYKAGTLLSFDFEDATTGSTRISGSCYYSGLTLDAPVVGIAKLTVPLQGTGEFLSEVVV